jgi:hypothetical protein
MGSSREATPPLYSGSGLEQSGDLGIPTVNNDLVPADVRMVLT